MKIRNTLLGVLAGVAAGAVLGAVLMGYKGTRAKKNITRTGEELANALNDKIDERFEELLNVISEKVKHAKVPNGFTSVKSGAT